MNLLVVVLFVIFHLIGTAMGASRSGMDRLYGGELKEFLTSRPARYTSEELEKYVVNSIKFVLNAAPDITSPRLYPHPWFTAIHTADHPKALLYRLIVPLLDDDFKPLFVTGKHNVQVPNFDVVQLQMHITPTTRDEIGMHYLRPEAILRPTITKSRNNSWLYRTHQLLTYTEKEAILAQVPFHGLKRERRLSKAAIDQIAHPSFANPNLKGLTYPDIYSPGYVGKGPRKLVSGAYNDGKPLVKFHRDWEHFFGLKQQKVLQDRPAHPIPAQQPSAELDLLSLFEPSKKKPRLDLEDPRLRELDLELHL